MIANIYSTGGVGGRVRGLNSMNPVCFASLKVLNKNLLNQICINVLYLENPYKMHMHKIFTVTTAFVMASRAGPPLKGPHNFSFHVSCSDWAA